MTALHPAARLTSSAGNIVFLAQAFITMPREAVVYHSRLALTMAGLAAILLLSSLPAHITFRRTSRHHVHDKGCVESSPDEMEKSHAFDN